MFAGVVIVRVHFPVRFELGRQLFLQHTGLRQVLLRAEIQHHRADLGAQEMVGATGAIGASRARSLESINSSTRSSSVK